MNLSKRYYYYILLLLTLFSLVDCSSDDKNASEKLTMPTDTLTLDIIPNTPETRKQLTADDIIIDKQLLYDQYTLSDEYPYKDTVRLFQWDKIRETLAKLENHQPQPQFWGIVQNRKNKNGEAPLIRDIKRNKYKNIVDAYGVERYQGIPLFASKDSLAPERYARDGELVRIINIHETDSNRFIQLESIYRGGEWFVPHKYVKLIDTLQYAKVVFVDRTNQNIAALEKVGEEWLVRSMNPATTGQQRPPYQQETPLGIFVMAEKKEKMYYYKDGTTEIGGFSPYASRFCNGAYIHGVPVNKPGTKIIEYSASLGTTPRSHMCVRNASSHAKFIYDWGLINETLVVVIE